MHAYLGAKLGLALCLLFASSAQAATTVANTNDSGAGSLRQAIIDAASGELITVPAGEYTLTGGELPIAKTVTIAGHGASDTTVRAAGAFRVFHISGAANDVTISGLTIRNGNPAAVAGVAQGGGVLSEAAELTLRDDVITENRVVADGLGVAFAGGTAQGAGVAVISGTLRLTGSTLSGNTASALGSSGHHGGTAEGGGLYGAGRLTLENNTFGANLADARGGQGPASAEQGGGFAEGAGAILYAVAPIAVSSSTISANVADASAGPGASSGSFAEGGGLWALSNGPPITLANLTVVGNVIRALPEGFAVGGDVNIGANKPGTVTLTNSTLTAGTADGGAGTSEGGDGYLGGETTSVENTIVSAGTAAPGSENCSGTPTSLGHNLDSRNQCNFHSAGDLVGVDPLLGPLLDNGGTTKTFAPLAGSPAINAGANEGCPAADQRGVVRPQVVTCDIGAVELAPPDVTTGSAGAAQTAAFLGGSLNPNASAASYHFDYGTSVAYGASTPSQPVADGIASVSVSSEVIGLAAGTTYHFRLAAQNAAGQTVFGSDRTFTTTPAASALARPVLSHVKQSRLVWREGSRLASFTRKHRPPVGTRFSFTLNAPARVTFVFTQQLAGRLAHGKCVAQSHVNRHKRACKRSVNAGLLSFAGHGGSNGASFQGRVSAVKRLKPGRYTVLITARNAAGASSTKRLSFTIAR